MVDVKGPDVLGSLPTIRRGPGAVTIEGIEAPTLERLHEFCGGFDAASWLVADLVLGSWQGHDLAAQLCRQLGLAPPMDDVVLGSSHHLGSYADAIADFVDAETRGDRRLQIALDTARRVVQALAAGAPRWVLILAPRYELPWHEEDVDFLAFLAQGMRRLSSRLTIVDTDDETTPLPSRFEVAWGPRRDGAASTDATDDGVDTDNSAKVGVLGRVPGLIDVELAAELAPEVQLEAPWCMPLPADLWLLDPALRPDPRSVSRLDMTRLAFATQQRPWLSAYAHCYGIDGSVDGKLLLEEGRRASRRWSTGIARRLFERAIACAATAAERSRACMMAQGPYITHFQFEDLAAMPDPPAKAPAAFRGYYLQNKAWGLVMTGRAAEAKVLFDQALALLQGEGRERREFLYLMNISALSLLRSGEPERALAREMEIRATLESKAEPDWHVEYINALNIARLFHYRKDFERAELELRRAFETTHGLRTQADFIYQSFYLGRCLEAQGRHAEAKPHWLQGALHWLSHGAPETLPVRVARLIRDRSDAMEGLVEAVSASWLRVLGAADAELDTSGPVPVFVAAEELPDGAFVAAVGAPGWSVLTTTVEASPVWTGPIYSRLSRWVHRRLCAAAPQLESTGCLAVDGGLGQGMPSSVAEVLAMGHRRGVDEVVFDRRHVALDAATSARLAASLRVRRSPAVGAVTGPQDLPRRVTYRRYRKDLELTAEEVELLDRLEGDVAVAEWIRHGGRWPAVRRLETERVIELMLPSGDAAELLGASGKAS